jgi:hypothetical protein
MPLEYKNLFSELENSNSFLYNIFIKDTEESFNEALKNTVEFVSFEKEAAITFRIDNDDAVPNNFIQKLNDFLKVNFLNFSICMPYISVIKRVSDTSYMVEERYKPSNSIGLAYVTSKEDYKTIIDLSDHSFINKKTSMILIYGSGGLMTINGNNAANVINNENSKIYKDEYIEKYLFEKNISNVNLKCIRILSKYSLKSILKLLIPPFFIFKIKKFNT